ncbi:hypothetical protein VTK73DRAFT_6301 [Phialemonium thermophilum]|uniref:Fibronectin type III-like domain-containing protein n=1 Tax=Phialemonium thermophilum TaxID=223376 RepID=A0ABR3V1E8_9PEZI
MTDMGLRPTGNSSSGSGNPGRTYRWYDQAVLPFGHGLHYTTFEASFDRTSSPIGRANQSTIAISDILAGCGSDGRWSNSSGSGSSAGDGKPHVKRSSSPAPLDLCTLGDGVRITVRNTGNVTSDFVALVFVSGTYGPEPRPLKTLAGYGRVRDVSPGQTVRVALPALTLGALARADERGNTVLYPGEYRLTLDVEGRSEVRFALTGEAAVLDEFPQPK